MLSDAIKNAFNKKNNRGWDKWPHLYVFIDLHDVIIPGTYTRNNDGRLLYPYAEEVLCRMSANKKFCLVLWTSSHKDSINDILAWLGSYGISFDYVNENPEVKSTDLLNVEKKPYFDLIFEDKAGFVGETDWKVIKDTLEELNEW